MPFSEHGLKEVLCLFCHSLHSAAWNLELALGPREDKGHILGVVEQKDDNEATETRAKLTTLLLCKPLLFGVYLMFLLINSS